MADSALLDATLKLATRQAEFGRADIDSLTKHGFTSKQALEAVVMTALTSFLNTAQMGLAPHPDFTPPRHFPVEPYPAAGDGEKKPAAGVKPKAAVGASNQCQLLGCGHVPLRRSPRTRIARSS